MKHSAESSVVSIQFRMLWYNEIKQMKERLSIYE